MNITEFYQTVSYFVPFDTGNMLQNGLSVHETPFYHIARYDLGVVPYIYYNEEGTVYSVKNKGFISQKTVGALNRYNYDGTFPKGKEDRLAKRQNQILSTMGAIDHVAGTNL